MLKDKKWESSSFILPNSLLELLRSYFRLFLQINRCWNLPSRLCNSSLREIILRIFTGSFDFVSFDFFIINPFIKLATKILTFYSFTNILSKKWIADSVNIEFILWTFNQLHYLCVWDTLAFNPQQAYIVPISVYHKW